MFAQISGITVLENGNIDSNDTVNEGSRITLGGNISGGENYRYEWTQTQGKPLMLLGAGTASPSFTIPADYIESDTSTSTDVVVQLRLEYGRFNLISMSSKTITIMKINNEIPRLDAGLTVNGLTLSFDDERITDSDGNGTASAYQWQRRNINMDSWTDIDSATTAGYTVPNTDPDDRLYRVRVTYTDAQGYSVTENVAAIGFRKDIDIDDDGLIEINDLETLNAIRFQPGGSRLQLSGATPTRRGCAPGGCKGYELTRNLDFNDNDSYSSPANRIIWTTGEGWHPIGDSSNAFTGQFEGNGYTISNLMISRPDTEDIGLFGFAKDGAEIANVGLLNVRITGNEDVGGLVGENGGTITNSYVTGSIAGDGEDIGGLVGQNVGGGITNSYVAGSVSGDYSTGGLVGDNEGDITNGYATGSVSGDSELGGLVGANEGDIRNSYATGSVTGSGEDVGGLVGFDDEGTITNSYWDTDTSGIETSAGGTSKTTVELQSPTEATGIYSSWGSNNWDFGTSSQYPALRYVDNPNTDSSECRRAGDTTTDLPVCGSLLSPALRYGLSELQLVEGNLSPDFDVLAPSYNGTVVNSTSTIQFRPITVNPDAKVYIMANEEPRSVAIDSGDESSMISLNIDEITEITIEVENGGQATQTVIYTLYLNYYEFSGDVDRDDDGLIEIDDLEGLNAIRYQPDGTGYRESETAFKVALGCPNNQCRGYELTRNLDFNDDDSYSSTANRIIWTTGAGWQPIGDFSSAFTARFHGNGYTILHLFINSSGASVVGLFGYTGKGAEISNLGLLNLDITGSSSDIGGLVGENFGVIINSYITGSIAGGDNIGGLTGRNSGIITNSYVASSVAGTSFSDVGGLVGVNESTIANSYAMGSVAGSFSSVGGLVGRNEGGITNSYATSSITGISNFSIGGLVGVNDEGTGITNSYATNSITGTSISIGGLVGVNHEGTTPTNSYWDTDTSGIEISAGGTSKTTVELQLPTTATEIYSSWSSDNWDFGTSLQYPILKYTDSDILLPGQGIGLRDLEVLTSGVILSPIFGASTTHYVIAFVTGTSNINLKLRAYNPDATIEVIRRGEDLNYFENKGSEGRSEPIPIDTNTELVITVTEAGTTGTTIYTISPQELEMPDVVEISGITVLENGDIDSDDTVNEGSRITLGADISGDGNYRYEWTQTQGKPLTLSGSNTASPSFTIPADYIESDTSASTDVVVQLTLEYGQSNLVSMLSKTLTILKINNDTPILDAGLTVNGLTLSFDDIRIIDLDGNGTASAYQWQRRDIAMDSWVDIDFATTTGYSVPSEDWDDRLYRVRVTYTDAQGYSITENVAAIGFRKDIDIDDDGLIDIYYLEHLNAIRYALDGSGYQTDAIAMTNTRGCPTNGCNGYELTRSLDFFEDASYISTSNKALWTTGVGWQPIGNLVSPLNAVLRASTNNLVIRNLYINRPDEDYVGLFGAIDNEILNIHLRDVDINGRFILGSIAGASLMQSLIHGSSAEGTISGSDTWVGGLIGTHYGSIINSYARGEVIGDTSVGGLAGYALGPITNSYAHSNVKSQAYGGGLVGYHQGQWGISNSYASGSLESVFYAGGLVGFNDGGIITNAYALGDVVGDTNVGGLVGYNDVGTIANTYALGTIVGANNAGGLAGAENGGSITGSYTATQLVGANLAQSNWSSDNWEADGTNPPKLKYGGSLPGDSAQQRRDSYGRTTCGAENMPLCGVVLPDQDAVGGKLLALSELTLSVGTLEPPFNPSISEYEILDISGNPMQTTVTATANKTDATVSIGLLSQAESMSQETSLTAQIADLMNDNIVITVTASGQTTNTYTITLPVQPDLTDIPTAPCNTANIDLDSNGLIDICDIEGLYAIRYQLSGLPATCGQNDNEACRGYELLDDLDFDADASYRNPQTNKPIWSEGRGWHPIGTFANPFNAIFNGNDYSIANLRIDRTNRDYVGLFGHIGVDTTIEDIELVDAYVRGRSLVGALAGRNEDGTIINSYTSNATTTTLVMGSGISVGGLVGEHKGIIDFNSYTSGIVRGNRSVGGLVGYFRQPDEGEAAVAFEIVNSRAESAVQGRVFTGGLVGVNVSRIVNSYATGDVQSIFYAGGLVGLNVGITTNTYATGDVSGVDIVGGLVGDNRGVINNSYAIGTVMGQVSLGAFDFGIGGLFGLASDEGGMRGTMMPQNSIGGLAGNNNGVIINSYAVSNLGLVGMDTGMVMNSDVVEDIPELEMTISGWDTENAWFFEEGKQPALRYVKTEVSEGCERDMLCGELSEGQSSRLVSLMIVEPSDAELVMTDRLNYQLRIFDDVTRVVLTPTADDDNTTVGYSVNNIDFNRVASGVPITIDPLLKATTAITITLESINRISADYTVSIERTRRELPLCTTSIEFPDDNDEVPQVADIDKDNDGFIEICDLEGLDEIRYALDGSGYKVDATVTTNTTGCPADGCNGYELTRNLDFTDDDSYRTTTKRIIWTTGAGWQPIGDSSDAFTSQFEGNDFTISNLMIDRSTSNIGLFGHATSSAEIANLGLLNINITASSDYVGGLVGWNESTMTNTYATGSIIGTSSRVGGLVGRNAGTVMDSYAMVSVSGTSRAGGLVGRNYGMIMNSYATGSVVASARVGGLIGRNTNIIASSYATGSVEGTSQVGGLVGRHDIGTITNNIGTITNSYATGVVTGDSNTGGLVGRSDTGITTDSYWDINTGVLPTSAGGTSRTTVELQSPTTATGIYNSWSSDNWDFGTSLQYPVLRYVDSNALLPGQGVGLRDLEVLTSGVILSPIFGVSTTHYVISFLATRTSEIDLRLRAYDPDATIEVIRQGEARDYFENKGSEGQSEPIPIGTSTELVITVTETDASTIDKTIYTISTLEANIAPTIMITPSSDQTLPLDSTAHIVVSVADDNFNLDDVVTLGARSSDQAIVSVEKSAGTDNITNDASITFTLTAEQSGTATITFTVADSRGLSDSAELLVRVNTAPTISGIPERPIRLLEGLSTELDVVISDADADDTLTIETTSSAPQIATVNVSGSGATRTLEIDGVSADSAMITVTVDDRRDAENSRVSADFEVQVAANTAPTITLMPSSIQPLSVNSTAQIVVSVADGNFDLDDVVTLEAKSSSPTVVSVTPVPDSNIMMDTMITFMLSVNQGGAATITFIATDRRGLSDSKTVSVNGTPMSSSTIRIRTKVFLEGPLQ